MGRFAYGVVLLGLAAAMAWGGASSLPWGAALLWPAIGFLVVGVAFTARRPELFGKRPDGTVSLLARCALAPYVLVMTGIWHVIRRFHNASDRVEARVLLGQRPRSAEAFGDATLVVDLTCEFPVERSFLGDRDYVCLPTVDGTAPDEAQLRALLPRLTDHPGTMYVHCAAGHGRSATVVAAVMIARGQAQTPEEAVAKLRAVRRGVRLSKEQWELLIRVSRP